MSTNQNLFIEENNNISNLINTSKINASSTKKENLSRKKQFDYSFKIVLIGDSGVGKSSFLLRFADDKFNENFYATVGVDFRFKSIEVNEKTIKYEIWDTAGQERFKTITSAYYRGADCVIIMYDVTDKSSFLNAPYWIEEVLKLNKDNPLMILVGNKIDVEKKEVDEEDIKNFIKKYDIEVIEASAKSSHNIESTMIRIGNTLIKKEEYKQEKSNIHEDKIKLKKNDNLKRENMLKTNLNSAFKKCNCN